VLAIVDFKFIMLRTDDRIFCKLCFDFCHFFILSFLFILKRLIDLFRLFHGFVEAFRACFYLFSELVHFGLKILVLA
jgi:hypothetical protein